MNFGESFDFYDCAFKIELVDGIQQNNIQAPRIMIEQQFMSLVQQAAQSSLPVKIILSRIVPVYDEFNGEWIEREVSISFSNSACEESV